MAKVIQVIEVEITRGKGVEGDVMRGVTQYWSLDGDLLAEYGNHGGEALLKKLYGSGEKPVKTFT